MYVERNERARESIILGKTFYRLRASLDQAKATIGAKEKSHNSAQKLPAGD